MIFFFCFEVLLLTADSDVKCVTSKSAVGVLCDHQPWLPSSLLAWGRECVLLLCSSRARARLCMCVYINVCMHIFGHTPQLTRGQVRLGLVPDSWKRGQLQHLTLILLTQETHTHTHTHTHAVKCTSRAQFIVFFFFIFLLSSGWSFVSHLHTFSVQLKL